MRIELFVPVKLTATHSLEENDTPHSHTWKISVGLTGPVVEGRVVSLPGISENFQKDLMPIQDTFLNSCELLDAQTRKNPTCENLCYFLLDRFQKTLKSETTVSEIRITSIEISVSGEAEDYGFARLTV